VGDGYDLAIFDMDGVLVDCGSSWVAVHDHFGVSNEGSLELYLEKKIDDLEFMRRDIALWKQCCEDLHISQIREVLDKVPLMPNLHKVFQELKEHGIKTAVVSGGIDILAERVMKEVECDLQISNGLEVDRGGYLTGEGILRVPVLEKDRVVRRIQEMFRIDKDRTVSIGNSQVDVQMFKESEFSIAFCPEDQYTEENSDLVLQGKDLALILKHVL
jgi:phosphoserine phosphatase